MRGVVVMATVGQRTVDQSKRCNGRGEYGNSSEDGKWGEFLHGGLPSVRLL
jgi:hypothetical protein